MGERVKDGLKKGRKLFVEQLFDGCTLLIRNGGARNGEPSTKSKGSDLRALFHFSLSELVPPTLPHLQLEVLFPKGGGRARWHRSGTANGGGLERE